MKYHRSSCQKGTNLSKEIQDKIGLYYLHRGLGYMTIKIVSQDWVEKLTKTLKATTVAILLYLIS